MNAKYQEKEDTLYMPKRYEQMKNLEKKVKNKMKKSSRYDGVNFSTLETLALPYSHLGK